MVINATGQVHTVHENSVEYTFFYHNFQGGDAISIQDEQIWGYKDSS